MSAHLCKPYEPTISSHGSRRPRGERRKPQHREGMREQNWMDDPFRGPICVGCIGFKGPSPKNDA